MSDDKSDDTATILQNLEAATPPAATSTPQQSLRISVNSQFQYQSNLLEQDSEMQHVIEGFNSYEGKQFKTQENTQSQQYIYASFPDVSQFSAGDSAQGNSARPNQTVANESTRNNKDSHSSRKNDLHR